MKKPILFQIHLEIYPTWVLIAVGHEDADLRKHIPRTHRAEDSWKLDEDTEAKTVKFSNGSYMIRLRQVPTTPADFGVVAHEVFHAVSFVMDAVGVQYCGAMYGEAWAYLTGYITRKLYRGLKGK